MSYPWTPWQNGRQRTSSHARAGGRAILPWLGARLSQQSLQRATGPTVTGLQDGRQARLCVRVCARTCAQVRRMAGWLRAAQALPYVHASRDMHACQHAAKWRQVHLYACARENRRPLHGPLPSPPTKIIHVNSPKKGGPIRYKNRGKIFGKFATGLLSRVAVL